MAPESHPIMLLERIRNCRYYWQLYCFELLRLYLTCTRTPLDSAPSKPLRPLIHLIKNCPLLQQFLLLMHQETRPEVYGILHPYHTRTQLFGKENRIRRLRT